jgi:ATP-dependent Lon protease
LDLLMNLLLIPLDDAIVFPATTANLPVDAAGEERVFLLPRKDGEFGRVGVVAEVVEQTKLPNGVAIATVVGLHRGLAGAAEGGTEDQLRIDVQEIHDGDPGDERTGELEREYRAVVEEILEIRGADERVAAFLRSVPEAGALADTAGYSPDLTFDQKLELLEALDVSARLELAVGMQRERLAELQVRRKIRDDVDSGAQAQQREYFLRKQMESIRKELGEDEEDLIAEYEAKIAEAEMPEEVNEQATKELRRLERQGEQSAESSMIRSYLDWLIAIPWAKRSDERLDPDHAREVLDADHAGLEDVKERITEFIAVRKLRQERGASEESRANGAILTLVGPPGTGKTSIGESIARALDREFVRISLGGIRDEAEIRGHRRTYIGALPGRIARAVRDAGTMNPVVLLDEVDKVGADWRGDPSAALLEVLDPAQNHSFRDHYLDVEMDLSEVVFIATANMLDTIPPPLLDRMELVSFDGYTTVEKLAIGRDYLLPRQLERNGLEPGEIEVSDAVLSSVITEYTREAGVRQLERELGKLLRKSATKIAAGRAETPIVLDGDAVHDALGRQKFFQESVERTAIPGVATGLAVTGTGGDVLFIEATAMDGDKGLVLTGQLGDVMKESAKIALSYVRSHATELGVADADFQREFHLHVPAGAIPKDGPSAGTAMTTALASLLSGRPVKHTVGMTGEVTLQGRVLPIGGLKQKVLAAHAAGLTEVILPERNRGDLEEVPEDVREQMTFHPVMSIGEVLDRALEPIAEGADVAAMS